jgi:hypothetical protein
MNLNKSMLKVDIANDLGADLEDSLDSEQKTTNELAGGANALKQAAIKVPRDLVAKVEDDTKIKDGLAEHEVRKMIKEYLTRAGDYLNHLSTIELQKAITQGGRVEGLRQAMALIKKQRDTETVKLKQMLALAQEQEDATVAGVEVPRTAAEAARAAHGSAAERKAATETEKTTKKKTTKKKTTKKKTTKKKAATKAATG